MIIALVICVLLILIWFLRNYCVLHTRNLQRAQRFYEVTKVYPELRNINHAAVKREVGNLLNNNKQWVDWPEKNLWDPGYTGASWTVFPLIAFGKRVDRNCAQVPVVMEFIERMDREYGVRIALLSRLGPGMKLVPHQGWGAHSNSVLRCHYGVFVPSADTSNGKIRDCRIEVADEIMDKCSDCSADGGSTDGKNVGEGTGCEGTGCDKCYDGYVYEFRQHRDGEWIVFDDSKMHLAENNTSGERIVLILDLTRPRCVPAGTSTIEDTTELKSMIAEHEKK